MSALAFGRPARSSAPGGATTSAARSRTTTGRQVASAAVTGLAGVAVIQAARLARAGPWVLALAGAVGLVLLYLSFRGIGRALRGPGFDAASWLSVAWMVLLLGAAVFAALLPIASMKAPDFSNIEQRPRLGWPEPLGTDDLGRSLLSRVVYGSRITLGISVAATAIGAVIGGAFGLVSGYLRGLFDEVATLAADVMLSFPPLILLLGAVTVLPKNAVTIALCLGVLMVPTTFRIARANTMSMGGREFVFAARCLGARPRRIIARELLPNIVSPVLAYLFVVLALIVVAEGSLSYLGVGVQPPTPSWGRMIADAQPSFADSPHMVFVPSAVMFITLIALNQIGDRLRASRSPGSAL